MEELRTYYILAGYIYHFAVELKQYIATAINEQP
jgi:hypothetical protein